MLLLAGLPEASAFIESLTQKPSLQWVIGQYNDMCRPWPEAAGEFWLVVADHPGPLTASVEQIGKMFYLKLGGREFVSDPGADRQFSIPIEHYCAATGTAVSAAFVRDTLRGEVTLASPTGVGWSGTIQANMRGKLDGPLPGFLPIATPPPEGSFSVPIRLERPRR
jgi:hypothetical protein